MFFWIYTVVVRCKCNL